MAAADGCALSVPGLKDVLSLNRRAPPPNVSVKKSDVHVGDNIYCQGTVNMYVDTSSPDIIKSITNRKPVTVNEGWRGRLASLSRKEKAIYLTGIISVVGALLLFVCIYFPLAYHAQQTDEGGNVTIISREMWRAEEPASELPHLHLPQSLVIIAHTQDKSCYTVNECSLQVRQLQRNDMQDYGDIRYNFLFGGDGNIYVGRNWSTEGNHTEDYNHRSIGVAFIGNFMMTAPPQRQLNACLWLLKSGTENNQLTLDYKINAQKQLVIQTESPGQELIEIIKKWSHWSPSPA